MMRAFLQLRAACLCCVIGVAFGLVAQSAPDGRDTKADEGYPEQAYLSPSRYVNQYFGFSFDLPEDAHLSPQPEPAARDGSIPLLDLAGPAPADAEIAITAIPTAGGKNDDAKTFLRQALDQELYRGVEELHGLSKASLSGHQFYLFETRRGIEQHMLLATTMGEYIVRVLLAAHDEKTVKRLETSFERVVFFAPTVTRTFVDAKAKPYDGPSISSHRLAHLESDPPAKHIDAGNISGDFYENSMLGFSYRIPQGWSIESEGAVQSAVERYRTTQNYGRPRLGRVEHKLAEACGKTLFSAWAKRPGADGQFSYDDFGEVTVSAMSLACFPNMKFPQETNDKEAFKDFLREFALTHPIVDDMREGKVFTQDGITFLFLEGTVAFQVPDDELSRRLSLGLAITERRGYLLTWFFAAPHDNELRALTNERASFDRGTGITVASAPKPGGGVASEAPAPNAGGDPATVTSPAATANASATTQQAASPGASSGNQSAPAPSPGESTTAAQASSSRPSLLRPGETMDSQQGKGATIKKQQSRDSD
jgi:hypothetical protein